MERSEDEINSTTELEDTLSDFYDDNRETPNEDNKVYVVKKKSFMIISFSFVILIFVIFAFFYLFSPKLTLKGDRNINLEYKEDFREPGYKASYFGKDITSAIIVDNKIDNTKLGSYKISYIIRKNKIVVKKIRTVNVVDTTKPEIVLEGDETVNVCPNKEYEEAGFTATDNYDGDLTDKVTFNEKEEEKLYIVTDSNGNKQIVSRKFNRVDSEKPTITLKGSASTTVIVNNKYTEPGYTATDNCDGDITSEVKVSGTVNTAAVGTYKLTYTVKDKTGNEASVTRTVTVSKSYPRIGGSSGCGSAGTIYLTFDDGPSGAGTTKKILDVLKAYGVKATFFVMGKNANNNRALLQREASEGHAIGIHTWTHEYGTVYKSSASFWNEVNKTSDLIKTVTGKTTKLFRFPGGASNTVSCGNKGIMKQLSNELISKGYNYFDWNISSGDAGGTTNPTVEYNNVIKSLSKSRGNVILMHDIKVHTANAIENIVKYGKNNGYKFDVLNTSINCKQAIAKCHG